MFFPRTMLKYLVEDAIIIIIYLFFFKEYYPRKNIAQVNGPTPGEHAMPIIRKKTKKRK